MSQDPESNSDPVRPAPSAARYTYTFEEFASHLDAHNSRPVEDARYCWSSFDRNILRLGRYFSEFYEGSEAIYKTSTFITILDHLTKNQEAYDTERFGVQQEDGGLLVSVALQRSVHWYFTSRDISEWGPHEQIVSAVKDWARQYIKEANKP